MTIGEKIRRLRLHKNWTQQYLAQQLGVTELTVRNLESGKCRVRQRHIERIAEIFGIDKSTLIDMPIQTYHEVMQNLFFLREKFGLRVASVDDIPPSKRNMVLYFDNDVICGYIEAWKKKQNEACESIEGTDMLLAWEVLFPGSFAEECSLRLDMYRKRGAIKSDNKQK